MDHRALASSTTLVENIGELLTLAPLVAQPKANLSLRLEDLGSLNNAWLLLENGQVKDFGTEKQKPSLKPNHRIDAEGCLVTPGLVDCHTHPIFGGDRAKEFAMRLDGMSYQDIAAKGGGIRSTIQMTRKASQSELKSRCLSKLKQFLQHGVTTVEVKSGYGQNPEEEIRLLTILNDLKAETPQTLSVTCLGLHAKPQEYESLSQFIEDMTEKLLPVVAENSLADWVDAFVENEYFTVEDCQPYFKKAIQLGLKIRIHADEFQDSCAAEAAAAWRAYSADHLEEANSAGLLAMAKAGTVAVILPGTSLYAKIPFVKASALKKAGCMIALASDFNPGSCQIDNLSMLASVGALHCGLSTTETFAAVTYYAARSLNLHHRKGSLAKGADGDFVIHQLHSKEQWLADFGSSLPREVYIEGRLVHKKL